MHDALHHADAAPTQNVSLSTKWKAVIDNVVILTQSRGIRCEGNLHPLDRRSTPSIAFEDDTKARRQLHCTTVPPLLQARRRMASTTPLATDRRDTE
jgi:hypothetical protein